MKNYFLLLVCFLLFISISCNEIKTVRVGKKEIEVTKNAVFYSEEKAIN